MHLKIRLDQIWDSGSVFQKATVDEQASCSQNGLDY